MHKLISQPHDSFRLGDFLRSEFGNKKWTTFRAAVAFAKKSGTQYIADELNKFAKVASVNISVGVDHGGTSAEALHQLLVACQSHGHVWVYRNAANTFHPKMYYFSNDTEAVVVVGSGNLTKGGLYENAELSVQLSLDLTSKEDKDFLDSINKTLDIWSTPTPSICYQLTEDLLDVLCQSGDVPTEQEAHQATGQSEKTLSQGKTPEKSPFKFIKVQSAPTISTASTGQSPGNSSTPAPTPSVPPAITTAAVTHSPSGPVFGMTLQNTDVSVGQTTKGAQARSPEVFIPLAALDANPSFWGWSTQYTPDPQKYQVDQKWRSKPENVQWMAKEAARSGRKPRPLEKLDWQNVRIRLAGRAGDVQATLWFNPKKKDIRIRESAIRAAGDIGDIFLMRAAPPGSLHIYDVEVIKSGTSQHASILPKLTTKIRGSDKWIGYF